MNLVALVLLAFLVWTMLAGTILVLIYAAGESKLNPETIVSGGHE